MGVGLEKWVFQGLFLGILWWKSKNPAKLVGQPVLGRLMDNRWRKRIFLKIKFILK